MNARPVAAAARRRRVAWASLWLLLSGAAMLWLLSGCGSSGAPLKADPASGYGLNPALPPPERSALATVNVARATGWPADGLPVAAAGTRVALFAGGLDHPRWLHVLPNGDVLVAEADAPERPDDAVGIKGKVMVWVMKFVGAGNRSANRISLLRDTDGDGVADFRSVLLSGLNSPFGMALVGDALYVATTDAVLRFAYTRGATVIDSPGTLLVALPAGTINHHWTKNLIASADGRQLYVTVGSNSNVAERGLAAEQDRAAIWVVDTATGAHRVLASGLRNPNGLAWAPGGTALWTVVNERDELGHDLVPDYLTAVQDGGFYGWPYSWFGAHVDERVQPQRPDLVARALVPDYALGAHTASLGLAAAAGGPLPALLSVGLLVGQSPAAPSAAQGMFIGQHGSWNRRPFSGYKVVFVPFAAGRPTGAMPVDLLTGFLGPDGSAYGRPVGVALDAQGALLVADDVGNAVWRVRAER